jgi:DNA ligase-associated metallophosphoesterase
MNLASRPLAELSAPAAFRGLALLPQRAVWDHAGRTLFVADVHLGKAAGFRARGVPAPGGTTRDNLDRLSALLQSTGAAKLVVLGDFFHAREGLTAALLENLRIWRADWRRAQIILVGGNHDRHAVPVLRQLGVELVAEPSAHGGPEGRHNPLTVAEAYGEGPATLAGHLHPVARLKGPRRDQLRLPCFFRQGRQLVLPSFGEFTGGREINGERDSEVFAICHDAVLAVAIGEAKSRRQTRAGNRSARAPSLGPNDDGSLP